MLTQERLMYLAMKVILSKLPFPLLPVDTLWKMKEMIELRDQRAKDLGFDLVVHSSPGGIDMGISP